MGLKILSWATVIKLSASLAAKTIMANIKAIGIMTNNDLPLLKRIFLKKIQFFFGAFFIKIGSWFICEEYFGIIPQAACYSNPLHFTTRELFGIIVSPFC